MDGHLITAALVASMSARDPAATLVPLGTCDRFPLKQKSTFILLLPKSIKPF